MYVCSFFLTCIIEDIMIGKSFYGKKYPSRPHPPLGKMGKIQKFLGISFYPIILPWIQLKIKGKLFDVLRGEGRQIQRELLFNLTVFFFWFFGELLTGSRFFSLKPSAPAKGNHPSKFQLLVGGVSNQTNKLTDILQL